MIIHEVEQRSEEWLRIKAGKFSGSTLDAIMGKPENKTYQNAIIDVVFGILTGKLPEVYVNQDMLNGVEREPQARESYEEIKDVTVREVGFAEYNRYFGVSPDGLVGEDGGVEFKCPRHTTHIEYLLGNKLPAKYKWQVHSNILVFDRKWWDFMSYHPDLKDMPFIIRVERDPILIEQIEEKLNAAINEVQTKLEQLL